MTQPIQQKTLIKPSLSDVLFNMKQDIFSTFNCMKIGQIQSFDPDAQTATVQILFKRLPPTGQIESYRVLVDCPVYTPQGGGGYLQFPIAPGDQCIVLFADRRIDEWFQSGAEALPGDKRMHDLSDGIVIVGLNAMPNSLPTYPSDKVILSYQGTSIALSASGIKWLGTGGAEVDMAAGIVTIKNMTTTLLTLMNNFITLLETLQVVDPVGPTNLPLTPAFIALLEAFKAQFATLLG